MTLTTADQNVIDLLDAAARAVRDAYDEAMLGRDFDRLAMLTDASQAVHRALIAFDGAREN